MRSPQPRSCSCCLPSSQTILPAAHASCRCPFGHSSSSTTHRPLTPHFPSSPHDLEATPRPAPPRPCEPKPCSIQLGSMANSNLLRRIIKETQRLLSEPGKSNINGDNKEANYDPKCGMSKEAFEWRCSQKAEKNSVLYKQLMRRNTRTSMGFMKFEGLMVGGVEFLRPSTGLFRDIGVYRKLSSGQRSEAYLKFRDEASKIVATELVAAFKSPVDLFLFTDENE